MWFANKIYDPIIRSKLPQKFVIKGCIKTNLCMLEKL